MRARYHPSIEEMNLPMILHALSDPIRLSLVLDIVEKDNEEYSCSTFPFPVVKSTVSHHIRTLREAGILRVRTQGTQNLISLRSDELEERFPGLLKAIIISGQKETVPDSSDSSEAEAGEK